MGERERERERRRRLVVVCSVCCVCVKANMATAAAMSFDAGHRDVVHDVQFDFYGKRLATASSDRSVKIFEVVGSEQKLVADLAGHEGPVWQVSWAHPKFGNLLASCSFDQRVMVWKEVSEGNWQVLYQTPPGLHTASINAVTFAPQEVGLVLAAASSDGSISILTYNGNTGNWSTEKIANAHSLSFLFPAAVTTASRYGLLVMLTGSGCSKVPTSLATQTGCVMLPGPQTWVCQGARLQALQRTERFSSGARHQIPRTGSPSS